MSNRTAEASKAIREAWERERTFVSTGFGTRDWTREQQLDIIYKGKAYDEDGKAFEGHHMKSAEKYPQYQGDANNIQFLTRTEHKAAHGGDFHRPTNGYYDYISKTTTCFSDKEGPRPLKEIQLTNPIRELINPMDERLSSKSGVSRIYNKIILNEQEEKLSVTECQKQKTSYQKEQPKKGVKYVVEKIQELSRKHPKLANLAENLAETLVVNYVNKCINKGVNKNINKSSNTSIKTNNTSDGDIAKKDYTDNKSNKTMLSERNYPESRKPMKTHLSNGGRRSESTRKLKDGKEIHVSACTFRPTIVNPASEDNKKE